jgi:hypothetical protein
LDVEVENGLLGSKVLQVWAKVRRRGEVEKKEGAKEGPKERTAEEIAAASSKPMAIEMREAVLG